MPEFDFSDYFLNKSELPEQIAKCLTENTEMPLGPDTPNVNFKIKLHALTIENAFTPHKIVSLDMAKSCLSSLWLYHNFLDESHRISQDLHTQEGSYWHAIMHRREPDFWNSKYWFRRVGQHPIFPNLRDGAAEIAASLSDPSIEFLRKQSNWDAFAFVDLCEKSIGSGSATEQLCEQIQMLEWHLLFAHCYHTAIGK